MQKLAKFRGLLALTLIPLGLLRAATITDSVKQSESAAANLTGATLSFQYYYEGGPYESSHNFIVGSGGGIAGEIGLIFHEKRSIDFGVLATDGAIIADFSDASNPGNTFSSSILSLPPTIYNGFAIDILFGPPFVSVTIDPVTNMVGFDATHLSFTANQIQVDFHNLPWTRNTIVKLDVITGF